MTMSLIIVIKLKIITVRTNIKFLKMIFQEYLNEYANKKITKEILKEKIELKKI